MTKFGEDFDVITVDAEAEEADLLNKYEELTGEVPKGARYEKIMLSVIAYAKTLLLQKINECFKNLLLPYAKGIWLDILGYLVGCIRIGATSSYATLSVVLYEVFSFDKVIPAGSKVESIDGENIFETTEDLVIPAGDTVGEVTIKSVNTGSSVNYGIGEINGLIENYEFVESVTNTTACVGGTDEEDDDAFRERIATAPEHFSTAGTIGGYEYYIKSAHKDIVDVQVILPDNNASIEIGGQTYEETDGVIDAGTITAEVDYYNCSVDITSGNQTFTVNFPKQGEVDCYILTSSGVCSPEILDVVDNYVSADDKRPLTDYPKYFSAIKNEFTLSPIIYIERDADFNTVKTNVLSVLNEYLSTLKKQLNTEVLPTTLIKIIRNVTGVYDVDLNGFVKISADPKKFNEGSLSNPQFVRREAE